MNYLSDKIIDDQGNVKTVASGQDARLYYIDVYGQRKKYLLQGEVSGGGEGGISEDEVREISRLIAQEEIQTFKDSELDEIIQNNITIFKDNELNDIIKAELAFYGNNELNDKIDEKIEQKFEEYLTKEW